MQDLVKVTGIVLSSSPAGEYDRRLVLLTKERGKITAFAKGARRQTSRHMAAANLFAFGEFILYPGRSSYTLTEAKISNYFEELRLDFEGAYYGMYFLEVADYYTRENNDETEMLKLLYQSLRALSAPSLDRRMVRSIFEIKAIVVNGEFPGFPVQGTWQEATRYTVRYIEESEITKLYTFTLTKKVKKELYLLADLYRKRCMDRSLKSLEFLEMLEKE